MPKLSKHKPLIQMDFFGNHQKSFFGRNLAQKLAGKKLIAKSRIARRVGTPKTMNPIIEVGELFENLSKQGFQSKRFVNFLTSKNALLPFLETDFMINREALLDFSVKNFFPQHSNQKAVEKIKPLLKGLIEFLDRQQYARQLRKLSKTELTAKKLNAQFKRMF